MTRTDVCPLLSHFSYGVKYEQPGYHIKSERYGQVYCNHGFPGDDYYIREHAWSKNADLDTDRCAFWNKCKRENGWEE